MCRKKKKTVPPEAETAPANPLDGFELKKPEPAYDENGNRDYFTEYYNAYKNNYIDQYLEAYKRFKAEGIIAENDEPDGLSADPAAAEALSEDID